MPNMKSLSLTVQKFWPRLKLFLPQSHRQTDRAKTKCSRIPFRGIYIAKKYLLVKFCEQWGGGGVAYPQPPLISPMVYILVPGAHVIVKRLHLSYLRKKWHLPPISNYCGRIGMFVYLIRTVVVARMKCCWLKNALEQSYYTIYMEEGNFCRGLSEKLLWT